MKRLLIAPLLAAAFALSVVSVDASATPAGFHRLSGVAVVVRPVSYYRPLPLDQYNCHPAMPAGFSCGPGAITTPDGWLISYGIFTADMIRQAARANPSNYGTIVHGQRLRYDGYATRLNVRWFHFAGGWIPASELWRPFAWRR